MRRIGIARERRELAAFCAAVVLVAGAYAFVTLSAILAIRCDRSPDPQQFCVWWRHSAPPTLIGIPAVLALGCYASFSAGRRRPVAIAGALVVLTCVGLREAAAPDLY